MVGIVKGDGQAAQLRKELGRSRTKEFSAHNSKAHCVSWNCTGKYIASGSLDKTACIQSFKDERLSRDFSLKGHEDAVDQIAWHPSDPNSIATVSTDKTLRLWDIRTPTKTVACIATKGEVINMNWKADGSTIALGNKDDLVSFVDLKTHKIQSDKQFDFEVNEIAWNTTDSNFYVTSGNGAIHVLSYPALLPLLEVPAHTAHCICLKFSPDKVHFATGGADALINIWDVAELACLRSYSRLEWPIRTLSFNHDGTMLAAGSEDLVIDIAHTYTGEKITTISCNAFPFCVAWHPKQNLLAFVTDDKTKHGEKHSSRDSDKSTGCVKLFGL